MKIIFWNMKNSSKLFIFLYLFVVCIETVRIPRLISSCFSCGENQSNDNDEILSESDVANHQDQPNNHIASRHYDRSPNQLAENIDINNVYTGVRWSSRYVNNANIRESDALPFATTPNGSVEENSEVDNGNNLPATTVTESRNLLESPRLTENDLREFLRTTIQVALAGDSWTPSQPHRGRTVRNVIVYDGENFSYRSIEVNAASVMNQVNTFMNLIWNPAPMEGPPTGSEPPVIITKETYESLRHEKCAICINEFDEINNVVNGELTVARTPCCHVYHPSCLRQWLTSHKTCPMCRNEISNAIEWLNR